MQRSAGFTLIELMITVVIIAILTAIALPSYQDHIRRAVRSAGQQFLLDLAQRQEQYFLDVRWYASGIAATSTAGMITMTLPESISTKYTLRIVVPVQAANVQPTYLLTLTPIAGSIVGADGNLVMNNLSQRWRELDNNGVYDSIKDCTWENTRCTPTP